jgi:SpoVK/Ycf46/Vps4 family AAA+-type ATPase
MIWFFLHSGTGKTLVARALANSCAAHGGQKVAFFMRKGQFSSVIFTTIIIL